MTVENPRGPNRRALLRNGLLVGFGTAVAGITAPLVTGTGTAQAYVGGEASNQFDWAWCDRCQGLFYGPYQSSSWCPVGGRHDGSESWNYILGYNGYDAEFFPAIPSQPNWAWCDKCMGLFYGPYQSSSWCPADGRHDGSESYSYEMYHGDAASYPSMGFQAGWAWCDKCQGQFYGTFQSSSWCPAGGRHNGSESYPYLMAHF